MPSVRSTPLTLHTTTSIPDYPEIHRFPHQSTMTSTIARVLLAATAILLASTAVRAHPGALTCMSDAINQQQGLSPGAGPIMGLTVKQYTPPKASKYDGFIDTTASS